jgi:hypothetical protein
MVEKARVDLAREVNDRIASIPWASDNGDKFDFLCECGAEDCSAFVSLTLREYAELRQRGRVLVEGHSEGSPLVA